MNTDGTLANVVVYIKEGSDFVLEEQPNLPPLMIDIRNWRFDPHVLAVQIGQPINIRNSGITAHNVNATPTSNPGFNFVTAQTGTIHFMPPFTVAELGIPVADAVHPWMSGYICVIGHPYFNVTGSSGTFRIEGLAPGTYVVEVWHEKLGTKRHTITIAEAETAWLEIAYYGGWLFPEDAQEDDPPD